MNKIRRCLTLALGMSLLGCTQNAQDLSDTFSLAFSGSPTNEFSSEQVSNIPYASLFIKQGEAPTALTILAWVEKSDNAGPPTMKWLSKQNQLVVTQAGRITKTVNLIGENLTNLRSNTEDPLAIGLNKASTPKDWSYTLSWSPNYYINYPAFSHFEVGNIEPKKLVNGTRNLLHVVEHVSVPLLKSEITNQYWLDPSTGKVVTSIQTPAPSMPTFILTVAKPYKEPKGVEQ